MKSNLAKLKLLHLKFLERTHQLAAFKRFVFESHTSLATSFRSVTSQVPRNHQRSFWQQVTFSGLQERARLGQGMQQRFRRKRLPSALKHRTWSIVCSKPVTNRFFCFQFNSSAAGLCQHLTKSNYSALLSLLAGLSLAQRCETYIYIGLEEGHMCNRNVCYNGSAAESACKIVIYQVFSNAIGSFFCQNQDIFGFEENLGKMDSKKYNSDQQDSYDVAATNTSCKQLIDCGVIMVCVLNSMQHDKKYAKEASTWQAKFCVAATWRERPRC